MSAAAKSVMAFGVYLLAVAAVLIGSPNVLLNAFGFTPTTEPWIRVVGVLVACIATYYVVAGRFELTVIMRTSVLVRLGVALMFLAFVVTETAETPLLMFGGIDLGGAIWTALALRSAAAPSIQAA
jgi:hypothetical protein